MNYSQFFTGLMIYKTLLKHLPEDKFWQSYFSDEPTQAIHLAVFVEPYLTFLMDGTKTVESRFSIKKCAPYMSVNEGDAILVKKTGGPIVGLCHASYVWNYKLDRTSLGEIKQLFSTALCINDEEFWVSKKNSIYATLIKVDHVISITPFLVPKKDRRGWVVVSGAQGQMELQL